MTKVLTGPRGGRYTLTKTGKKRYIKKETKDKATEMEGLEDKYQEPVYNASKGFPAQFSEPNR